MISMGVSASSLRTSGSLARAAEASPSPHFGAGCRVTATTPLVLAMTARFTPAARQASSVILVPSTWIR
jgi:hypothetical protein